MNKIEQIKELKALLDSGVINDSQYNQLLNEIVGSKGSQEESVTKIENSIVEKPNPQYDSVVIGKQEWMTENLRVKTFRNGDKIMEAASHADWVKAEENKIPAWCYYDDDPQNGEEYGILYNNHAVMDPRGLAPEGYKIPTEKEIMELVDLFGGTEKASRALKSRDSWFYDDFCETIEWEKGTNKSGFNARPCGTLWSDFIGKGEDFSVWLKNNSTLMNFIIGKYKFIPHSDYEKASEVMEGDIRIEKLLRDKNNSYYTMVRKSQMTEFTCDWKFDYVRCIKSNFEDFAALFEDSNFDYKDYGYPIIDFSLKRDMKNADTKLIEIKDFIINCFLKYKFNIFKIRAHIGPSSVLFQCIPNAGVRISHIKDKQELLEKDFKDLNAKIFSPIPGEGTIGILVHKLSCSTNSFT